MEVIWHKSPSYAELFFRECFFTNAKNVTWIYRNAYLENQVIMGLVRMYHDVRLKLFKIIKIKNQ
jgi:hypothetical protein